MAESQEAPHKSLDRHMPKQRTVYSEIEEILQESGDSEDGIGRELSRMPALDGRPCVACFKQKGTVDDKAVVGARYETDDDSISVFLLAVKGETLGHLTSPTSDFGEPRDSENPTRYLGFKTTLGWDDVSQDVYGWPEGAEDWVLLHTYNGEEGREPDALDFAGACKAALEWKPEERKTEWAIGTVAMAAHDQ